MFADSYEASLFRVDEQVTSRTSSRGTLIRLVLLFAIAALMLVATIALRFWTAANDATLPPIEYGKPQQRSSDLPSQHEERNRLTFPLHPQI